MDFIVTSTIPGRRRGGGQWTGATKIDASKFTVAQLQEIAADPALTLVAGVVVTAADVASAYAGWQAAQKDATAKTDKAKS